MMHLLIHLPLGRLKSGRPALFLAPWPGPFGVAGRYVIALDTHALSLRVDDAAGSHSKKPVLSFSHWQQGLSMSHPLRTSNIWGSG
jgi:hypothetical protein